ncbi:hypothetical protein FB567DRAFT_512918 [Paraphoma chrysanthemicola]|uniref:Uncharacterized protein n=1 Tax=Paraphoma chrysanthemicola TaxID=798071 RepID=A0A8K0RLW6_9PLEO|nr:hypothetical protein FB567DRAFT_512918 [Paraphoma chrysanthemicola]
MARNVSFQCPSGGDWYVCLYGTKFAGCCSVDPCLETCPQDSLFPIAFDPDDFRTIPDASCGASSNFYSCTANNTFLGCCRSNACVSGCPKGDLGPASLEQPSQRRIWGSVSGNTSSSPPVQRAPVARISSAPAEITYTSSGEKLGRIDGLAAISVAAGIMIAMSISVALWLWFRGMRATDHKHERVSESEPQPTQATASGKDSSQTESVSDHPVSGLRDLNRLGSRSLSTLGATIFVELCVCGFLAFLWYGHANNQTWNKIMVYGWATRSIAVAALVLRTAVDLQAALGSAILASLLLESGFGVQLHQVAGLSSMRAGGTSPWSFAWYAMEGLWRSVSHGRRFRGLYLVGGCLLLTSSLLQFASTLLLSDLRTGPLVADVSMSQVRPDLSYLATVSGNTQGIPRGSAWTTNPPSYPVFGEYHEPIRNREDGVADTGLLLRAFLPYKLADDRQRLSSYSGNALVMDARVSCQAPTVTQVQASAFDLSKSRSKIIRQAQISGLVSPTKNSTMLQSISTTPFNCTLTGSTTTVCQLALSRDASTGSLKSQFPDTTSFGTAYLVLKSDSKFAASRPWANFSAEQDGRTVNASASLCFAPWNSAVLNVELSSKENRTEPLLRYVIEDFTTYGSGTYQTQDILNHLIPSANTSTRQLLAMEKPRSYLGDLPPLYRRPVIQSDISPSFVGQTNNPLPGNWSAIMSGTSLVTTLRNFEIAPIQYVAADPAVAAIFNDALNATSIEWALSSVITILSMTNYYGQQPAFDRVDNVTTAFFEDVLYPRDHLGLTLLMWALTAHFIVVAILVVLFVKKTRLTLLGNAWSAFAQLAESREVMELMAGASVKSDAEVLDELKEARKDGLRARVVWQGEGVEVVVK